ncbi:unnamed protein product [Diamesa hyperborea]
MAQCTVTSGDIKASAQATFSKKLEGVCSTQEIKDVKESIAALEGRLLYELNNLRFMMQSLIPQNPQQQQYHHQQPYYNNFNVPVHDYNPHQQHYQQYNNQIQQPIESNSVYNQTQAPVTKSSTTTIKYETTTRTTFPPLTTTSTTPAPPKVIQQNSLFRKSLETNKNKILKTQELEKRRLTTTTTKAPVIASKNEYMFYWKLENFPKVFTSIKSEVFSHTFNVKGLYLRIRAKLHHLESNNFILDLEHLANTNKDDKASDIELFDGGFVFQEIASEKLFQYSFVILDQIRPKHDVLSPIYWNTDSDNFLIPNAIDFLNNYIKNDSILIKLIITF